MNRWFWIYVSNMVVSGLVAWAFLVKPAHADEWIVFNESEVEVILPSAVPTAFKGFDHEVLLGQELEALEELETEAPDTACAPAEPGLEASLSLASRSSR